MGDILKGEFGKKVNSEEPANTWKDQRELSGLVIAEYTNLIVEVANNVDELSKEDRISAFYAVCNYNDMCLAYIQKLIKESQGT